MTVRVLGAAVVLAMGLFCAPAAAQEPPPSATELAVAREVVQVSGAEAMMTQMMDLMLPMIRNQMTSVGASAETADRFASLVREEFLVDFPRMLDMTALAYAQVFTEAELLELRDFYASPTGSKLVATAPQITEAMSRVGREVGREVGLRALARMQAEQSPGRESP